ncbi:MAG: LysE family transporter [Dehalococcoidia bacterium]|nr:LysE family transporter [Dehalococcoidia bacterium]
MANVETSLGLFLLSAAAISLTGVILPGPMTAATIAKGYGYKHAGALIAMGHAVVEIPLMVVLYFGLARFLGSARVVDVIYVAGGLALFYLGFRMFRSRSAEVGGMKGLPSSSLVTGIVLTGGNPGFYVWWATIGMALIAGAGEFGLVGFFLFIVVHWSMDLIWSEFLSVATFRSRKWWSHKVQKIIFTVCALVLVGFGATFTLSAFFR